MGKFIIRETPTGIKFDLKTDADEILVTSEVYSGEAACKEGVESVKVCSAGEIEDQTVEPIAEKKHPKFEMYADKAGDVRFRLKARNGKIVATSSAFKSAADCLAAIEKVKASAPAAEVIKG